MFAGTTSTEFVTAPKHLETVLAKTPQDLAESLEIMVIDTRPKGPEFVQLRGLNIDARRAFRGAIAMLTGEPTSVSYDDAVRVVDAFRGLWVKHRMPARELICVRILEVLREKHAST